MSLGRLLSAASEFAVKCEVKKILFRVQIDFFKLNYTPYNVLTIKDMCRERERLQLFLLFCLNLFIKIWQHLTNIFYSMYQKLSELKKKIFSNGEIAFQLVVDGNFKDLKEYIFALKRFRDTSTLRSIFRKQSKVFRDFRQHAGRRFSSSRILSILQYLLQVNMSNVYTGCLRT